MMGAAERVSRREVVRKSDEAVDAYRQMRNTVDLCEQRVNDMKKVCDHSFNEARATSIALEMFQARTFRERVRWVLTGR